ncbi:carbohydrate ABC transporter membrane protein 2 (CUT1 family) [Sediminihabitans luteus]|uniref:Carbohydrate ABC transporter membrane protein 2 (CUT1 family) n=1 Tax=Sediminihabitans luteus TaxID=1138585 RepID=A0A2M9CYZ7_9CELL|nr:carbohydrate ABC transporter permease [Sediminihabitans luteus]PJJ77156.1 carbohydrate ABC transporter membrane protein 2 (CUT1 family) [Sediminihabitans luteus]GII98604.1 sugar ABC transporter permease [Sediminihabitans luteus]
MSTTTAPPSAKDEAVVPQRNPHRGRKVRIAANTFAVVVGLIWFFPIYWMISSALLPNSEFRSSTPVFVNLHPTFEHVQGVLSDDRFWSALSVSARVTAIAVVVAVFLAFLTAVAISRFRFAGRGALIATVLVIQMIPAEALFISQYKMLDGWGLLNSVFGLTLLYVGIIVPFNVWILKGFIDGVPVELEQAAMIDGCTRFGAFFRVTLPLLGPGLVTAAIFAIITAWNEYTLALVVMGGGNETLPLWLQTFSGANQATNWGGIMAGSVLIALPVIILFMTVQTRMAAGLTAGAVKG